MLGPTVGPGNDSDPAVGHRFDERIRLLAHPGFPLREIRRRQRLLFSPGIREHLTAARVQRVLQHRHVQDVRMLVVEPSGLDVRQCRRERQFFRSGIGDIYRLLPICARKRSSCARSSGVNSLPKSSDSSTGRISTSVPPPNGARLSHSTASSIDFTCHSQKPAMSSFDSANGPSMTVLCSPENFTRLPFDVGWRPSPSSITPAFTSSSLNVPISVRTFSLGISPASDSLLAFTITMTRIGRLLSI